jgi:hypothetical protein
MGLVELWRNLGPGLAGAVFGAGWWFWVDAVACSQDVTVPFLHYLPGQFSLSFVVSFFCVVFFSFSGESHRGLPILVV